MTKVRIKVAKSESIPCKPILAKMAVNEAKPADANAQNSHALLPMFSPWIVNNMNGIFVAASKISLRVWCG